MIGRIVVAAFALPLAAFFAFVGWNKAFASLDNLRTYGAWTVWLPEPLGRALGWSEMLGAALLVATLIPRFAAWRRWVAGYFMLNQLAAAALHVAHGEFGALPQNALLAAAFAILFFTVPTGETAR